MNEKYSKIWSLTIVIKPCKVLQIWSLTIVIKPCNQGVVDFRQGQVTIVILVHIGGHKAGYIGKAESPRPATGSIPERHQHKRWCRGELGFREAVNQ